MRFKFKYDLNAAIESFVPAFKGDVATALGITVEQIVIIDYATPAEMSGVGWLTFDLLVEYGFEDYVAEICWLTVIEYAADFTTVLRDVDGTKGCYYMDEESGLFGAVVPAPQPPPPSPPPSPPSPPPSPPLPPLLPIPRGCTTSTALNYRVFAVIDDGSCVIGGCTDSGNPVYSPFATFDDGSCVVMYPGARQFSNHPPLVQHQPSTTASH